MVNLKSRKSRKISKQEIIAATNFPNKLDSAFISRVTTHIKMEDPTPESQLQILESIIKDYKMNDDVKSKLQEIIEKIPQFYTGRDLKNILDRAANKAAYGEKEGEKPAENITMQHIIDSIEHVEKKDRNKDIDAIKQQIQEINLTTEEQKSLFKNLTSP